MGKETETIEIIEPIKEEVKPLPTRDDLKERGFTVSELEAAERRGMIAKEKEDEKEKEKKGELSEDKKIKFEEGKKESEKEKEEKIEAEKDKFRHSQQFKDAELNADQEAKLRELFPFVNGKMNPVESIYWRMKNERKARQKAETEKKELEEKIKVLSTVKPEVPKAPEIDLEGNEIDPDEKPLTVKQLRELREQEIKEAQEKERALQEKGQAVASSLRDQEDYAKSVYPDFEETVKLAADLMKNLDDMIPDAKTKNRVISLIQELQVKAAKADELSLEDFNAADLSYEIGRFHPDYGKKKEASPKANGGQNADKVKRVEEATQRRGSSAGLNGGSGRRVVAPEEVSREDLLKMDYKQRDAFKRNHPELYRNLLWG